MKKLILTILCLGVSASLGSPEFFGFRCEARDKYDEPHIFGHQYTHTSELVAKRKALALCAQYHSHCYIWRCER